MMGISQKDLFVPVIKTTCGLLALTSKEITSATPKNCIRCGRCIDACPMRLLPYMLGLLSECKRLKEITKYHLLDCIECGCCAFVCPAKRPLVHYIKLAKYLIPNSDELKPKRDI